MKLSLLISWLLCLFLLGSTVAAMSVTYTIIASGKNITTTQHEEIRQECSEGNESVCTNSTVLVDDQQEAPWSIALVVDNACEKTCIAAIPNVELPNTIHIDSYRIDEDSSSYDVRFKGSKKLISSDADDIIEIKILGPVCNENTCDEGCVVCGDNSCHDQGYSCPALENYISVQRVVPKNLTLGQNQINVVVKNLFGDSISNVAAEISGYGVKTANAIPIPLLASQDKDSVFLTVNTSQAGEQDVIIRVRATYKDQEVKTEFIDKISVAGKTAAPSQNKTELSMILQTYRTAIKDLERQYNEKRVEGYQLLDLTGTFKDTKDTMIKAQGAIAAGQLDEASLQLAAVQFNLDDLTSNLETAQKPKRSITTFMKENVFWISAMITATLGAFALFEKQRQKMDVLKEKVKNLKGTPTPQKAVKGKRKKKAKQAQEPQLPA